MGRLRGGEYFHSSWWNVDVCPWYDIWHLPSQLSELHVNHLNCVSLLRHLESFGHINMETLWVIEHHFVHVNSHADLKNLNLLYYAKVYPTKPNFHPYGQIFTPDSLSSIYSRVYKDQPWFWVKILLPPFYRFKLFYDIPLRTFL